VGSCLGDLYSVNWMEDADKQSPLMKETLAEQYSVVKGLTTQSHVMQYGTLTFLNDTIGQFEGQVNSELLGRPQQILRPTESLPKGLVDSRDIKLNDLYYAYLRADKSNLVVAHEAASRLAQEVEHRMKSDQVFASLTQSMIGESWTPLFNAPAPTPIVSSLCVERAHAAVQEFCGGYSDYSMRYARVVYNVCAFHAHSNDAADRVVGTLRQVCA